MKANNLTISIPSKGCDKNCPYCVSKCTGDVESNVELMKKNTEKVLTMARLSQVSSVMLTGKGEPCLNFDEVLYYTAKFAEFPMEIQTNGIWLSKNLSRIAQLADQGMNVVALSVDDYKCPIVKKLAKAVHDAGRVFRVTFNVTNSNHVKSFRELFDSCKSKGVDQLTLRKIIAPNFTEPTPQSKWIEENVDLKLYFQLIESLKGLCKSSGHHLRTLPYGVEVYDLEGVAVSYSNYCIQDNNNTEDIRSLIFQEDGHVYTAWNSRASILF